MKKANAEEGALIPESTLEAVNRTLTNTEDLRIQMQEFISIAEPQVIAQLPPLERAKALLLLAKASSTLVALRLKCNGVNPNDHPVKTELERLGLYQEKLERSITLSKEPLRRATTLNYQAATRFIEHSLPDLTNDQRQSMRDISRGEAVVNREHRNAHKKRKVQSEKRSVRAAAQEFLEKATQELLGTSNIDVKGPLRLESSDEEDEMMD